MVMVKRKTLLSVELPVEVYIFACCHRAWGEEGSRTVPAKASKSSKRCSLITNMFLVYQLLSAAFCNCFALL